MRWISDLGDADLDPHLLFWDIRRAISISDWPRSRTTLEFILDGVAANASRWWLVVANGEAEVCDFDPGYEVTGTIETSLRVLTLIWRGDVDWSHAMHDGSVAPSGATDVRRAIPTWLGQGRAASVPRPA